ncbi:cytochrome P450 [Lactarius quietus]|nr:cytochrome P450 [Lactarius quietus]
MSSLFLALALYPEVQKRAQAELDSVISRDRLPTAVLYDPELYPDPEEFKPERFLNEDGTFRDDPLIQLAFGAGRRICPGRHFVAATLFVVTASVLSVFKVTRATDKDGNEIPVKVANSPVPGAIVIQVPHFDCAITPRDNLAEDLIRANGLA